VFQETNEIPTYGKHTCGDGKATERNVLAEEDREEYTYFDLTKLKEHLKNLPPDERHKVKDVERIKNIANGQMDEIDMAMRELEEEERENKNQPEPEN
jgi:hypothetical protein